MLTSIASTMSCKGRVISDLMREASIFFFGGGVDYPVSSYSHTHHSNILCVCLCVSLCVCLCVSLSLGMCISLCVSVCQSVWKMPHFKERVHFRTLDPTQSADRAMGTSLRVDLRA